MAKFIIDPQLAQELAEGIVNAGNGRVQETVVNAYSIAKKIGEDNPVVEVPARNCKQYEVIFNERYLPILNKCAENMYALSDLQTYVLNMQAATVADAGDMGHVEDNNYDAAKNL